VHGDLLKTSIQANKINVDASDYDVKGFRLHRICMHKIFMSGYRTGIVDADITGEAGPALYFISHVFTILNREVACFNLDILRASPFTISDLFLSNPYHG
jgi:hypothetical protein